MRNKVLSICGIICCAMFLFGIIYNGVSLEYQKTPEKVEVVDKSYDPNLAMQLTTKTYPMSLYANYNVYVLYEGKKHCLKNKELYDTVEIGDTIEVIVTKTFNKDGKLKHTEISIED